MTGAAQGTILTLLQRVGDACQEYHHKNVDGLTCRRIQCDEIWAFCHAKEKNVSIENKGVLGFGDVYTWTALDADTKLMINWVVGRRDREAAMKFIWDLRSRIVNRPQITTDGFHHYFEAIDKIFGQDVDYAIIKKTYGGENLALARGRYSPAVVTGAIKKEVTGYPLKEHISTSYVERQNLTMRMGMRRFTRLTNGFSKKINKMQAAVALHFMYYNFCRVHKTLRVTPAMEAGLSQKVWEITDVLALLERSTNLSVA